MKAENIEQLLILVIIVLGLLYIGKMCMTKSPAFEYFAPLNGDAGGSKETISKESKMNIGDTLGPNAQFVSSNLLPKPTSDSGVGNAGFDLAPQNLKDINFMQIVGTDTVNASLKNANLQLRSDPCIKRQDVSPWLNSTIECDPLRKPLE